jgi:hypothetical protein
MISIISILITQCKNLLQIISTIEKKTAADQNGLSLRKTMICKKLLVAFVHNRIMAVDL